MTTVPIKSKKQIEQVKTYFLDNHKYRDYTLFVIGINTALRIGDILNMRWEDIYDFQCHNFKTHFVVLEQKTGKRNCIALNENCRNALRLFMESQVSVVGHNYIFCPGKAADRHISRNRAWHIIKKAAADNHLEENISCHSMRKTFGYHAWKEGAQPALIMDIYNHSNIEITKRYLSINQDDKDTLFNRLNL